jgi:hypothetical protein
MIGYYPINPAGSSVEEDAFGPQFFRKHFFDRMKQVCMVDDQTPVLEVVLTSGQVLDVANIIELKSSYMLVNAFVDSRDCDNTYSAYVRYITIYRINVLTKPINERPIGFSNQDVKFDPEDKPVMPASPAAKAKTKKKK